MKPPKLIEKLLQNIPAALRFPLALFVVVVLILLLWLYGIAKLESVPRN